MSHSLDPTTDVLYGQWFVSHFVNSLECQNFVQFLVFLFPVEIYIAQTEQEIKRNGNFYLILFKINGLTVRTVYVLSKRSRQTGRGTERLKEKQDERERK